jgi:hypothetical protein
LNCINFLCFGEFFGDKPLFLLPDYKFTAYNMEGAVAQLVEQRTENPCVAGSIPAHTTNNNFLEKERAYSSAG